MNIVQKMLDRFRRDDSRRQVDRSIVNDEGQMIATGWDGYATEWRLGAWRARRGRQVQYLGDEWTTDGSAYGLAPDVVTDFLGYINQHLLDPYLPPDAVEGLEIGPGGGRLTALLVPRTEVLHLADASEAMLQHLKKRFAGVSNLRYYHTNGVTLPALKPSSLHYVIAFDVFVHFEPRLIFSYLRQIVSLLKAGGTGIIHYANALTPIGWQTIEMDLEANCIGRAGFGAFGVMCPQLMQKFLEVLEVEVLSLDLEIIPRDAIAVFRKPSSSG